LLCQPSPSRCRCLANRTYHAAARFDRRFVRVRAWYVDYSGREKRWSAEVDRRFYAATGVTNEQYREMNYGHPRRKELDPIHTKTKFRLLRTMKLRVTSFVMSDGMSPRQ
jgi:hypothetical protein